MNIRIISNYNLLIPHKVINTKKFKPIKKIRKITWPKNVCACAFLHSWHLAIFQRVSGVNSVLSLVHLCSQDLYDSLWFSSCRGGEEWRPPSPSSFNITSLITVLVSTSTVSTPILVLLLHKLYNYIVYKHTRATTYLQQCTVYENRHRVQSSRQLPEPVGLSYLSSSHSTIARGRYHFFIHITSTSVPQNYSHSRLNSEWISCRGRMEVEQTARPNSESVSLLIYFIKIIYLPNFYLLSYR